MLPHVDAAVAATRPPAVLALFSATLPPAVEDTARSVLHFPARVVVGSRHASAAAVSQRLLYCGSEEGKLLAMRDMLSGGGLRAPAMVFVQSVERARQLHAELAPGNPHIGVVHSDLSPEEVCVCLRESESWLM
jgi:ATP-dependent RNA helicase DDX52/ROK1